MMISKPETKKTYQNHRDNQLERILEAAEALFIRDGIDNVSMGAIADAARLARKTLYQYFPNKEEVAFAIFQKFVEEINASFDPDQMPQGTGYQRLEGLVMGMVNLLETSPAHFRFIVEFNTFYARAWDPARVRQVYAAGSDVFIPILRSGIADGSIRADLDPEFLAAATYNLVSGMSSRFALLGHQIPQEYGWPVMDLYRETCRIFLRGLKTAL